MLRRYRSFRVRNPGIVTRIFRPGTANTCPPITTSVAVHGKNRINGASARNYHLFDDESTERMVIRPGITSSGAKNPPEEWDSAGNYYLVDAVSDR
jgi:hypothetical protein